MSARVLSASVSAGGVPEAAEAAAIAAAVERFVADMTPPPAAARGEQLTGWQRAALLEGAGARDLAYPIREPFGG